MDERVAQSAIKTLTILANPTAGGYSPQRMATYVKALQARGIEAHVHLTQSANDISDYCANPDKQPDAIAIAGGDGTFVHAISGLKQRDGLRPPLAILPFGTANVLALTLGLNGSAREFAAIIAENMRRPVYTGLRNGKPFILMVSSGFDAQVVHALPVALKRRLGKLAYALTAMKQAFQRRRDAVTVSIGSHCYEGRLAIITNIPHYGGPMVICPAASALKPGLHLVLLERDTVPFLLKCTVNLLLNRLHKTDGVHIVACEKAVLSSSSGGLVQADGDAISGMPITIETDTEPFSMLVR